MTSLVTRYIQGRRHSFETGGARKNVARSAKIYLVWPPKIWSGPHLRGGQGGAKSVSRERIYCHTILKKCGPLFKISLPNQVDEQKKKRSSPFFAGPPGPPYFHSLAPLAPPDPWPPLARAGPQLLKSGGASGPPGPSGAAALGYIRLLFVWKVKMAT